MVAWKCRNMSPEQLHCRVVCDCTTTKCILNYNRVRIYHLKKTMFFFCITQEHYFVYQISIVMKADLHIACRAHAVPLPCRAAKCLECGFPI